MEEYKSIELYPEKPLKTNEMQRIKLMVSKIEGVKIFSIDKELISLKYNTYILSKKFLVKFFEETNILLKKEKLKSGLFQGFIKWLIKENKQSFRNKKLDCCDLNR